MRKMFMQLMAMASITLVPQAAIAGWEQSQIGGIGGHETWIFVPDTPIDANINVLNGKRALVVSLHGCAQKATELKEFGNWEPTAKNYGLVVAIPDVGLGNSFGFGCWDYNLAADGHNNVRDLLNIVDALKSRELQIDPSQIYITGLSSGAAMALEVACTAPHVFAGVGAVAGPSVGSDQNNAFNPPPRDNVERALAKCKTLAGANESAFGAQIASVAYGDLDKHGNKTCAISRPAGKKCLVPVEWTLDDAQALSKLSQCSFGNPKSISNGMAEEQLCLSGDGKAIGSLLKIFNVGHAWPAGSGDTRPGGGDWIDKSAFNYPAYVTEWFFANNRRVPRNLPPIVKDISSNVSGTSVTITGSASDPDANDRITEVSVKLEGQFPQPPQKASGASAWSATFASVANDSCYTPVAAAKDDKGAVGSATGQPVKVGSPPAQHPAITAVRASSEGSSVTVVGTAAATCAALQKVEVELGDRGFESAEIKERNFEYHADNVPAGVYATKVKATDTDGQSTIVTGNAIAIEAFESANATWIEHMNAGRIKNQRAPCSSVGFGACDAPFQTLFLEHQFSPFDLFKAPAVNEWYADPKNIPPG